MIIKEILLHPCFFYQYTGLYCPGCGGTRAVLALLQGHVLQSLWYHPLVLYIAATAGWYGISHGLEKAVRSRWKTGMVFTRRYLYLGLAIVIANWIVKNLLLIFFAVRL